MSPYLNMGALTESEIEQIDINFQESESLKSINSSKLFPSNRNDVVLTSMSPTMSTFQVNEINLEKENELKTSVEIHSMDSLTTSQISIIRHISKQTLSTKHSVEIISAEENEPLKKDKCCYKIQYIIFSLLCIASALTAMIVWYSNWLEDNRLEMSPMSPINKTFLNGPCQHWEHVGDGYCDDEANIEQCGYDLNDCCEMNNDRTLCSSCTCLIPEIEFQIQRNEYKTEFCPENKTHSAYSYFLGDGICQLNFNNGKFNL